MDIPEQIEDEEEVPEDIATFLWHMKRFAEISGWIKVDLDKLLDKYFLLF
jgi:hypothetical protein